MRPLAILALLAGPVLTASSAEHSDAAAAMAFVRVIGDVRIEFLHVWRQPILHEGVELGTGSGFVISPSGLILTNRHVLEQEPWLRAIDGDEVRVSFETHRIEVVVGTGGARQVLEATHLASDAELDIAVLQVGAQQLTAIPFGDSDALETGGRIRVLGFPFGRRVEVGRSAGADVIPEPSTTVGSLSAARTDDAGDTRYLQTDALIQPGNSGGPMLDADGYAVGVVRMKLSPGATAPGAGFGIPINLVKDFLDARGLIGQLPVRRLRGLVPNALGWKGLQIDWPEGYADSSPARLRVDAGASEDGISLQLARIATPLRVDELEPLLLGDRGLPDFVPGKAMLLRHTPSERGTRLQGTARGATRQGDAFRIEYVIASVRGEAVLARFVGPPDALAFNLGLLRRSLASLAIEALLAAPVEAPVAAGFEMRDLWGATAGQAAMPAAWSIEPALDSACPHLPQARAGLAASPPGDFTVVLRALAFTDADLTEALRLCGGRPPAADYARRFTRFGLALSARGGLVSRPGGGALLLELEAPEASEAWLQPLFERWLEAAAR